LATLKEKGRFFLVKISSVDQRWDKEKGWVDFTETSITTLQFFENDITIYSHDFFRGTIPNETIIGYCLLEFNEKPEVNINL
jgi:hypothetical protein